jgi:hypothetical protein
LLNERKKEGRKKERKKERKQEENMFQAHALKFYLRKPPIN